MALWPIVGIIYVLINGLVRKIYDDDTDMLLVLAHMFLWPIFMIGLGAWTVKKKIDQQKN